MEANIQKLMNLDCSREEAIELLQQTNGDALEALSLKMGVRVKRRRLNETQEFFADLRKSMEKLEDSIHSGYSKTDQSESLEQDEMQNLHEETVQQSNCDQECQIPSQELEVQIPETVCQSPSGYFYDLQLSDQKLT
jgi:predicted translin family RNA/ssDNA-binding protein